MARLISVLILPALMAGAIYWLRFTDEHTITATAYGVYALLEADDTPTNELKVRKANKGMCEIEIITDTTNAGYFRKALGG